MIVDANVLLYAVDSTSPHHAQAARWLTDALNGQERVGFAWQSIGAFVRIATHPRISANPLSAAQAQDFVDAQLAALAYEFGVAVVSADSDFARFPEVRWVNPLA